VFLTLSGLTAVVQFVVSLVEMTHWFGLFYSLSMLFASLAYFYVTIVQMKQSDQKA